MSRSIRFLLSFISVFIFMFQVTGSSAEALIEVTPAEIDFGVMGNSEITVKTISIVNKSTGNVTWMAEQPSKWLTLDRYYGKFSGGHEDVSLVARPAELVPGHYRSNIVVSSSYGTTVIPVSVTIIGEGKPTPSKKPTSIVLDLKTSELEVGRKAHLKAWGKYSDGSMADLTEEARWISENEEVAFFIDAGVLVSKSLGTTNIFAQLGNMKSPSAQFRVNPLGGPLLQLSLNRFDLQHVEEGSIDTVSIKIQNGGKGPLEWEAISRSSWLSVHEDKPLESTIKRLRTTDERVVHLIESRESNLTDILPEGDMGPKAEGMYLAGKGRGDLYIAIDAMKLREGMYKGSILVKSNGGSDVITVSINVVSLETLSISPVLIKINVGNKRRFRATGVWSDGKRSDLSDVSEGEWIVSNPSVGYLLPGKNVFIAKSAGQTEIIKKRGTVISNEALVTVEDSPSEPFLMFSPREVVLGKIGPGESSKEILTLRNMGTKDFIWSLEGTGGQSFSENKSLSGKIGRRPQYLRIFVESLIGKGMEGTYNENSLYPIRIRIDDGRNGVSYNKAFSVGEYREELRIKVDDVYKTLSFTFTVSPVPSRPVLEVEPRGIDFGTVETGDKLIRKIELKNAGRNILMWDARVQGKRRFFGGTPLEKGRYVSFQNVDKKNEPIYVTPNHLKADLIMSGAWLSNEEGYPESAEEGSSLNYAFRGTGITAFIWKDLYGSVLDSFVDGRFVGEINCISETREREAFMIADGLDQGIHTLTLRGRKGAAGLEGVRIYSEGFITDRSGWVRIFPEKGTATNEIDYVNVIAETKGLLPGIYCENLLFQSESGSEIVEVSLEISDIDNSEYIDIFRYIKDGYSALSSKDAVDETGLMKGYKEKGIAFRLFRRGTPGTAEFFWWYNPIKRDYFYSTDRTGNEKSLKGYVFGGSIGNIATLRISDSRELYRWYNPDRGTHFYTTDLKGEGYKKRGYQYDGIAGYVR